MAKSGATGLTRIVAAASYSGSGLRACWQHESAFRQEVLAGLVLLPLGLYLGRGGLEKALLVGVLLLVLVVELLNSSLEAVVDRIGHEHHELSGRAKDLGSAAVLLSLLNAALTWVLVLWF